MSYLPPQRNATHSGAFRSGREGMRTNQTRIELQKAQGSLLHLSSVMLYLRVSKHVVRYGSSLARYNPAATWGGRGGVNWRTGEPIIGNFLGMEAPAPSPSEKMSNNIGSAELAGTKGALRSEKNQSAGEKSTLVACT
jgi:hypothetical protein